MKNRGDDVAQLTEYERGMKDRTRNIIDCLRAGVSVEEVATALGYDNDGMGPQAYQDHLQNLRRIMGTDEIKAVLV